MKRSTKILFLSAAISLSLNCAEPSAFGAGDLSSDNPYGLTSDEKVILETKKKLKKVDLSTKSQASQLESLRERLDGLQSVVETLSRASHDNKLSLQGMEAQKKQEGESTQEYQKRLSEIIQNNSVAIETIKTQIIEISKQVDRISSNYVSKQEFNSLVSDINDFKSLVVAKEKSSSKKSNSTKISSAELYKNAKEHYAKEHYTKAIAEFSELIERNYKPAYSHYKIGEIYFHRKDYGKAISYYKKSTKLYAKGSYMPNLMLHTAISMDKTGDKTHAQNFYNAIIQKYPESKEAAEARELLN